MKCYKVVHKSCLLDTYLSAVACGAYKIEYQLEQIVKPVDGTLGIFVFKELSHAKTFLRDNWSLNMRILECDGKNIRPFNCRAILLNSTMSEFWEQVLLNKKRHKKLLNNVKGYASPVGTCICSELKPLKVIYLPR